MLYLLSIICILFRKRIYLILRSSFNVCYYKENRNITRYKVEYEVNFETKQTSRLNYYNFVNIR